MKKLLACELILTMLSSTGAMCFANKEVEIVNTIQVSATEVETTGESQDNKTSQEELLSDIETIKNDKSLTVKEKFERAWDSVKEFIEDSVKPEGKLARAWNYVKNFVKDHCIAVSAVAASVVFVVLAWLCGPSVVDALKGLFGSNDGGEEKKDDAVVTDEALIINEEEIFLDGAEEPKKVRLADNRIGAQLEEDKIDNDVIINEEQNEVKEERVECVESPVVTFEVVDMEKLQHAQMVDVQEEKKDGNVTIEEEVDKEEQPKEQKGWFGRFLDVILPTYSDNDLV